jgi:hypothetical protein
VSSVQWLLAMSQGLLKWGLWKVRLAHSLMHVPQTFRLILSIPGVMDRWSSEETLTQFLTSSA